MTSTVLLVAAMAVCLLSSFMASANRSRNGGGTTGLRWDTECDEGVKFTIQCDKCECQEGEPVNCKSMPCQTDKFLAYNARRIPASMLGCEPKALHTVCQECYCVEPNKPASMCIRMQCPPLMQ